MNTKEEFIFELLTDEELEQVKLLTDEASEALEQGRKDELNWASVGSNIITLDPFSSQCVLCIK